MCNLKPALSYSEQVERLITVHNLDIDNREVAIQILQKVSYYRLSGYGIGLKQAEDQEKYRDEITLEWLFALYCFDSQFKNDLIHIIEQLEIQFRTQISYHLAMKYGADGYLLLENFIPTKDKDGITYHQKAIESFQKEVKQQAGVPFVKHHIEKYGGRFPIWVAVELFTFGRLTSFFSIMKYDDRKAIASYYGVRPEHLKSWMLSLVEIRNICAHYTRLYNLPLKQSPYLFRENMQYRQEDTNKIFPVLLVIKRMLKANEQWQSFYRDIEKTINKFESYICFPFMGFPQNWRDVLSQ